MSPVANKTPPVKHCRGRVLEVAAMNREKPDIVEAGEGAGRKR